MKKLILTIIMMIFLLLGCGNELTRIETELNQAKIDLDECLQASEDEREEFESKLNQLNSDISEMKVENERLNKQVIEYQEKLDTFKVDNIDVKYFNLLKENIKFPHDDPEGVYYFSTVRGWLNEDYSFYQVLYSVEMIEKYLNSFKTFTKMFIDELTVEEKDSIGSLDDIDQRVGFYSHPQHIKNATVDLEYILVRAKYTSTLLGYIIGENTIEELDQVYTEYMNKKLEYEKFIKEEHVID